MDISTQTHGELISSDCPRTVWHQNLRATFDGISHLVNHDLLRIPKGTLLARYSRIWIAFFISGAIHAGMAEDSYHIRGSGTVRFFCTQALGIMLEDGVQAMWARVASDRRKKRDTPLWNKIVGFLWLLAFMTWSTPVWSYRMFQRERPGIDTPLGISIISRFL